MKILRLFDPYDMFFSFVNLTINEIPIRVILDHYNFRACLKLFEGWKYCEPILIVSVSGFNFFLSIQKLLVHAFLYACVTLR